MQWVKRVVNLELVQFKNYMNWTQTTNPTRITFTIPVGDLSSKELRDFMRNMMQPIQEKDIRIYKIGKILERIQQPK